MKRRMVPAALVVLLLSVAAAPLQADTRLIVRDVLGLNGLRLVCLLSNCQVLGGLNDPESDLFVVTSPLPAISLIPSLLNRLGVTAVEVDQIVQVQSSSAGVAPPYLYDRAPRSFYGSTVWNGYLAQPAASIIRAADARSLKSLDGTGVTVAVIDTGVDSTHPVLAPVLTSNGYDFTRNRSGADEKGDVTQSTVAVVDSAAAPAYVNQSTVAVVDQSTVAVVDGDSNSAFGHGTMVAGVIHLVAPRAKIMPLKSFSSAGAGYASDVIRAIYYAQQNHAKVINMSFSFATSSPELSLAVSYVSLRGVICVASAGNDGTDRRVYPAAYSSVIGVGSTTNYDAQSAFSNYGSADVWVAAPGEAVMTTYPWNTWAAAWGTSFSAPLVSGAAALLADQNGYVSVTDAKSALAHAVFVGAGMNNGRIDAVNVVSSSRFGGY